MRPRRANRWRSYSLCIGPLHGPYDRNIADSLGRRDRYAVHVPHRGVSAAVAPQQVALAVAVEVAGQRHRPVCSARCRGRRSDSLRRRSSARSRCCRYCRATRYHVFLSPLKSPVPTTDHAVGILPIPALGRNLSSVHEPDRDVSPVCCCATNDRLLPSPSKSPVPATDQLAGTLPIPPDDATVVPLISHIARLPLLSCHRMSPLPSPSKSPVATTVHVVRDIADAPGRRDLCPFMNHIAVLPLVSRHNKVAVAVSVEVTLPDDRPPCRSRR